MKNLNEISLEIPTISVVIPLYNKGQYIARAVNSVLSQSYQNFEVIIVDDGSTDDGADNVRKILDTRIRIIQQKNQGVSAARNKGVEEAEADLIAFLDADDEWMPKHLEILLQLTREFPNAGACATSYIKLIKGERKSPKHDAIPPAPWKGVIPDYFLSAALGDYPINSSVVCIKKEIFQEMGGFPVGIAYGEDADLWGKIAIHYPIAFTWEISAVYHQDAYNRACVRLNILEKEPFVLSSQEALRKNEVAPEMKASLLECLNKMELARAQRLILAGRPAQAKAILSQCNTKLFGRRKKNLYMMAITPQWIFKTMWKLKRSLMQITNKIDYSEDPFFKN